MLFNLPTVSAGASRLSYCMIIRNRQAAFWKKINHPDFYGPVRTNGKPGAGAGTGFHCA